MGAVRWAGWVGVWFGVGLGLVGWFRVGGCCERCWGVGSRGETGSLGPKLQGSGQHPQHCQRHPQDADDAGEWGDQGGGGYVAHLLVIRNCSLPVPSKGKSICFCSSANQQGPKKGPSSGWLCVLHGHLRSSAGMLTKNTLTPERGIPASPTDSWKPSGKIFSSLTLTRRAMP